jgi:hypothetical protein
MQLIQIGQSPVQTLQQFIAEMAASQSTEIQQLKQAALKRNAAGQFRREPSGGAGVRRLVGQTPLPCKAKRALAK